MTGCRMVGRLIAVALAASYGFGVERATAGEVVFRKTLISAAENLNLGDWNLAEEDVPLVGRQRWRVRMRRLHGGKQEGVQLVTVHNGRLEFTVIPTRGMGILEAKLGAMRLGWQSPVKEVVHPAHVNLSSREGLGWLDGFNEWMVRCGLEFAGHPGRDAFVTNTGDMAEMDLTLHGKIANIPASEVELLLEREDGGGYRIRVRGRVDERMFFGPQLELWTEVSTLLGSDTLRIADTVVNRGADSQEFEMIYHTNFGRPLLEEGARFVGPIARVTPMNDHAAAAVDTYDVYAAPTAGFVEQVYCMVPYADSEGRTSMVLHGAGGERGVAMDYRTSELPYMTVWKNTADEATGYVTGLEPGTSFPFNRRVERHFGRVPKLAAGESRNFTIDVRVLSGTAAVQSALDRVQAIQAGRPTEVERAPAEMPD